MTSSKVLNLDAKLGLADQDEPTNTREIQMFGRGWTLNCDLNAFALSNVTSGDPAAVTRFIVGMIVEAQQSAFVEAISAQRHMGPERLGVILNALVEAASDYPTTPPSDSRPTVSSRTSGRKSVARTGKAPVARLTS